MFGEWRDIEEINRTLFEKVREYGEDIDKYSDEDYKEMLDTVCGEPLSMGEDFFEELEEIGCREYALIFDFMRHCVAQKVIRGLGFADDYRYVFYGE